MKDNLPKGWSSKNINEVSTLIRGLTYKPEQVKSKNNGIACFRTKNIQSKLDESDIVYIDENILKSNDKYLQFGDVLVSSANSLELLGKCCLIKDLGYKATLGGFICAFRPDKKVIDYKYFYYYFGSVKFQEIIRNYANKTTGIANLPVKKVEHTQIQLPNLVEQKQIVSVLDKTFEKLDQAIFLIKENIQKLKQLNESILDEVFENKHQNWKTENLKKITVKIGSGSTPTGGQNSYKESGISLIRSLNVHDWGFKEKNLAYIDEMQAKKLANVEIQKDDVLLNITGASVARCCLVPDHIIPARVNQHVSILRVNKEFLLSKFLYYLLISPFYKKQLLFNSSGGATREALSKAMLEKFQICYPSILEQQCIVNYLDEVTVKNNKLTLHYNNKLTALKQLKNSVLDSAFKGELRRVNAIQIAQSTVDPFLKRAKSWNSKKNADKQAMIIALAIEAHEKSGKSLYRTKGEKTVEIIEKHINLDFGREAKKMAAGPAAFEHLVKVVEPLAKEKKWFAVQDIKGENFDSHKYIKEENFNPFLMRSVQDLKSNLSEIRRVIDLFVTMKTTHEAEVISTTYTGWNNLIIRNEQIVDEAIVSEARENWHDSKLKIERQEFFNAIEWLRKNNLIPKGNGKEVL